MAAIVSSMKFDSGHVPAAPDRGARLGIRVGGRKCCFAAICVVGLLPTSALAQITGPLQPYAVPINIPQLPAPGEQPVPLGQTVTSRPRPEFDPTGLRFGDFFWFPRAELDESYNSNIFATTTSPSADLISALAPSFDLLSNFPRNALNLHGSAVLPYYAEHPTQSTPTGTVSADGRLDVTAESSLYGNAQVSRPYISYGSPNSPMGIAQPVTYWDYLATAGYMQRGRRFSYQVDVGVEAAQYNAAQLVSGGVLPQSSQDATSSSASVRASYEIVPDYLGYIRLGGNLNDYWHATHSNFTTYRIDLGLQIFPRHLIYGEAYVGYLVQNFTQSSLPSTSAPDFGGRLVWNVTPLDTLTFTGLRTFTTGTPAINTVAVTGPAGNSYLSTTVTVNADHELRRNLLLNLNATYSNYSFQGLNRTDNSFTGGAGLKYLVNRNLFVGGLFTYERYISTASGASFTQNILTLRVGTQF
jgi:hypothetical protein